MSDFDSVSHLPCSMWKTEGKTSLDLSALLTPLSTHVRPLCSKVLALLRMSSLVACIEHCQFYVFSLHWIAVSECLMSSDSHKSHGAKLDK